MNDVHPRMCSEYAKLIKSNFYRWNISKVSANNVFYIINTGSAIYSDFYLHVTLGRIKSEGIVLDDIRRLVDEVNIQPYTVYLREVVYRF